MYDTDAQFIRICLKHLIRLIKRAVHTVCDIVRKLHDKPLTDRFGRRIAPFLQICDPDISAVIINIRHTVLYQIRIKDPEMFLT